MMKTVNKSIKKAVQCCFCLFLLFAVLSGCGPTGSGKANEETNKAGMPDKSRPADSLRKDSENNLLKDTAAHHP